MAESDGRAGERPDDPAVDRIVLGFIGQIEEGFTPDLDRFCDEQPESLRAQVRDRCKGYLEIQRVLGHMRDTPRADTTGTNAAPPDPLIGRQLGSYVIEKRLGEGGMGIVYLARQPRLDRPVAVKVLPSAFASKRGRRERFEREARLPAKLDHPGIVKVFDAREEGDVRWYAMEYVAGRSLHEIVQELRRLPSTDGSGVSAVSKGWITRAAEIAAEVADALEHAHLRGVVHRDLKPGNVLLDGNGAARVIDFGLALDLAGNDAITADGEAIGTIHYMSPEQARGDREKMGALTDVYSLGVILYEMLTLRRPFENASRSRELADIAGVPPRPVRKINPRVPHDLETICLKALEKNPQHRYANAAAFARDLRHFLNHEAIEAQPPPIWRRLGFEIRRRRALLVGFGAGAAVVITIATLLWRQHVDHLSRARITIDAAPEHRGARVLLRSIDPKSGEMGPAREIGRVPLKDFAVEPGFYRVIVDHPGFGFCEMTRRLQTGETKLAARILETATVAGPMTRIPAGKFIFGSKDFPKGDRIFGEQTRELPEFLIDDHEVTNDEYWAFLKATSYAGVPFVWEGGGPPAGTEALPVVGLYFKDVVAYAEWVGKRLPTVSEWEKAARGTDGRLYPWGNFVEPLEKFFPQSKDEEVEKELSAASPLEIGHVLAKLAFSHLQPAKDPGDPDLVNQYRLRHMMGNAAEWTESVRIEEISGIVTEFWDERFLKGGGWRIGHYWKREAGLTFIESENVGTQLAHIGFRCAKSITP